ncbi:MAG TPA: hypothetical protein VGI76_03325, partial [Solirubrobacteraceae bacterium]
PPRRLETLREDFQRLPELLALPAPEQPHSLEVPEPADEEGEGLGEGDGGRGAEPVGSSEGPGGGGTSEVDQLGLF